MKVNLKIVRSQRRLSNLFRGILSDNPVLVGGMALIFMDEDGYRYERMLSFLDPRLV